LIIIPPLYVALSYEKVHYYNKPISLSISLYDHLENPVDPDILSIKAEMDGITFPVRYERIAMGKYNCIIEIRREAFLTIEVHPEKYGYIPFPVLGKIGVRKPYVHIAHNIPLRAVTGETLQISISTFNPQLEPIDVDFIEVEIIDPHGISHTLSPTRISLGTYAVSYTLELSGVYYFKIKAEKFGYAPSLEEATLTTYERAIWDIITTFLLSPLGIMLIIAIISFIIFKLWKRE